MNFTIKIFLALFLLSIGLQANTINEKEYEEVFKAVYANDITSLKRLVQDRKDYFSDDELKFVYSDIGSEFLIYSAQAKQGISFKMLGFLHKHGLDLNDLKPMRLSYEVEVLLEKEGVLDKNIDLKYLKPSLKKKIEDNDLDLNYYVLDRHLDYYYLDRLANQSSDEDPYAVIVWLLENGYEANKREIGFALARLLDDKENTITAQRVDKLRNLGMKLYNTYDNDRRQNILNSYAVLREVVSSGRMDDMALLNALIKSGMDINAEDFFNYGVADVVCSSLSSDKMKVHIQGLKNLVELGLEIKRKEIKGCSHKQLEVFTLLGNEKYTTLAEELLAIPGPSFSDDMHNLMQNPIVLAVIYYGTISLIVLILLIFFIRTVLKIFGNKKRK